MSFSYRLRVGGYSLNTRIRLQSFKVRAPKETPDTATAFSATEKDSLLSATSKIKSEDIVREGAVRVKEYGVHPRSWFFKIKWLVLYEEQLALHASQTKAPRSSISLANIEKLERTNRVPCGLTLQTKNGRRYLLSFEKDSDLYDWQDEICRRSMGVGLPHNFVHKTHCSFDPISGAFTGLPAGWVNAHYQNINLGENVVPENAEPVTSLVITRRGATSQVQYVWRVVSLDESLESILESVCHKMGLESAVNFSLALPGDKTSLVGIVADLQGRCELEIIARERDEATAAPSDSQTNRRVFITIKMDDQGCRVSTTVAATVQTEMHNLLQIVCRKTKLDPSLYMLKFLDGVEPLAMNHTVDELMGKHTLRLVKRDVTLGTPTLPISDHITILRISLDETYLTTLAVAAQSHIQEVFQRICSKVQYQASEYTLSIAGCQEALAMDLTVADLGGKRDLILTKRDDLETIPAEQTVLRVNLRISPDETFLDNVSVFPHMRIKDVLERVCAKMKFRASDYMLALTGGVEPLEMDLTVAGLDGKHELVLVKCAPGKWYPEAWYSTDSPKISSGCHSVDA